MARPKRYGSEAEKQAAYRLRKKGLGLVEKESVVETRLGGSDVVTSEVDSVLPWPLNVNKSPRWGDGVDHYVAPSEEEKEAMSRLGLERSRKLREERKNR